jgi:hypothetical protein
LFGSGAVKEGQIICRGNAASIPAYTSDFARTMTLLVNKISATMQLSDSKVWLAYPDASESYDSATTATPLPETCVQVPNNGVSMWL